eukprot:TRINITY_DN22746_c0_g1_i2.p1 TRINITY_DN22746_c0_g1~~TRINITY_DN22746_c0_g1_i2.p1  ORF type:complete len:132 (+),score=27.21 TRINITY_DN22746_c0_g1_i2:48-443(+)
MDTNQLVNQERSSRDRDRSKTMRKSIVEISPQITKFTRNSLHGVRVLEDDPYRGDFQNKLLGRPENENLKITDKREEKRLMIVISVENQNFEDLYNTILQLLRTLENTFPCLLYTSPSPRDRQKSRMPSSA